MRSSPCAAGNDARGLVAAGFLVLAGCGDAVLVVVDGDRAIPEELDAVCLAIGDRDPAGGQFGRLYRLEGDLASLPQSLAVEAGGASSAIAWARGYRGGAEVARARGGVDFGGDVELRLDRCAPGSSGEPATLATAGPFDARLVPVLGRHGSAVVAVSGGVSRVDAEGDALVATDLGIADALGAVAIDADGDCDDDLVVWGASGASLWRLDAETYVSAGDLASFAVSAGAAADVDRDGDQDLVLGGGTSLQLYRGGADGLTLDEAALPGGVVSNVTALVLGDLDADGNPDLIAGQGAAPPRAFVADASGAGVFAHAPAILPDVDLDVRDLALADLDADADLDLAVAIAAAQPRVYVNRGGRLEDQSFVRLPQPTVIANQAAIADWNGDCLPDLVFASDSGSVLLRGAEDATFVDDAPAGGASSAAFVDIDDDGDLDVLLGTPDGVAWMRR